MEDIFIHYFFTLEDSTKVDFKLQIGGCDFLLRNETLKKVPEWAILSFNQCPHCTIDNTVNQYCPLAINIVEIVEKFAKLTSFDYMHVDVVTVDRTISKDTTAQHAISSLIGLVIATSGCPHTAFLKPMARFHLPLSSEEETIYRAGSMYMLAQYYRYHKGKDTDFDMNGLVLLYDKLQVVNTSLAKRLRAAIERDSSVNAVILLDLFAILK